MSVIKLLIAEDNLDMCGNLREFFELTEGIEVVSIAHTGGEALKMIEEHEPDVMLLDLMMPDIDGIGVLERLPGENAVKVIVTSAIGEDNVTARALALGAKYYVVKPYNLEDLTRRIHMVLNDAAENRQNSIQAAAATLLISLGMQTNLMGYKYCLQAIIMLIQNGGFCPIVKVVYQGVSAIYSTTPECVEVAIRTAIKHLHEAGYDRYRDLMNIGTEDKQPSNGRFLTMASEYLKLNGNVTGGSKFYEV